MDLDLGVCIGEDVNLVPFKTLAYSLMSVSPSHCATLLSFEVCHLPP